MTEDITTPLRALVTGSRKFSHLPTVQAALQAVALEHPNRLVIVVHGAAQGADRLADTVARRRPHQFTAEPHPAEWRRPDGSTNRAAGIARNQEMVNLGADVCLAFYQRGEENRGTSDCVRRARAAGIRVLEYWSPED